MFQIKSFRFVSMVWFTLILTMPACQTLNNSADEDERLANLINTQKSVVINYLNQGQADMALKELRALVLKHPKDADFKNLLGLTYLSLRNYPMAEAILEEAYELQPKAHIALNLSSAYLETKQYARGLKLLKDLKSSSQGKQYQYPERIEHNMAIIALRMQKPQLAEKHFQKALQDNPFYYVSLMQLGQLYEKSKRSDLALEQFAKARNACLKCYDPLMAVVRQQVKKGQTKAALAMIQEYLVNKEVEPLDRSRARKLLAMASRAAAKKNLSLRKKDTPPASQKAQ